MMRRKNIRTVRGVVDWRLCLGCGVCSYICPERKIALVDAIDEGIRPIVADEQCSDCRLCLDVCPGFENDHVSLLQRDGIDRTVAPDFGPVLEIWEGHAKDAEVRHLGSSGGAITALALYCLEREGMDGVLHLGADAGDPIRNRTHFSQSRKDLLRNTGSRYAPGSVCDGLDRIESARAPCLFIGQPSEVTALRKAQRLRPRLNEKVGFAISFFCAGSPATRGTVELLRAHGIDPAQVDEIRYRGVGWPGTFAVRLRNQTELRPLMSYQDSWGALQRFRPYGIFLYPDLSGEDADVSCADAWHRKGEGAGGYSLLVVRTEGGRRLIHSALQAGYIVAERVEGARLMEAQQSLVGRRGAIWGRTLAFRLMGLPVTRLKGFGGPAAWWRLSGRQKLASIAGTMRRVLQRGYYRPLRLRRERCVPRER
jgi:coenzyme F420 hydrogenase subunit beta